MQQCNVCISRQHLLTHALFGIFVTPFFSSPSLQSDRLCTMPLCTATSTGVSVFSLESGKWQPLDVPNLFTIKLLEDGSSRVLTFNTGQQVCQIVHMLL